jgi:hypothetical protein
MPRWRIQGAERSTGKDASVTVEAADEDAAVRVAGANMFVESVERLPDPPVLDMQSKLPPVAALSPVITPRPTAPSAAAEDGLTSMERWAVTVLRTVAILGYLIGLGNAIFHSAASRLNSSYSYEIYSTDRFQSDNAIGATANALERMKRATDRIDEHVEDWKDRQLGIVLVVAAAGWHICSIMIVNRGVSRLMIKAVHKMKNAGNQE